MTAKIKLFTVQQMSRSQSLYSTFISKKTMRDDGLKEDTCQRRRRRRGISLVFTAEVGTTMFDPRLKGANAENENDSLSAIHNHECSAVPLRDSSVSSLNPLFASFSAHIFCVFMKLRYRASYFSMPAFARLFSIFSICFSRS